MNLKKLLNKKMSLKMFQLNLTKINKVFLFKIKMKVVHLLPEHLSMLEQKKLMKYKWNQI